MSMYLEFLKKSFRQRYIYRANSYIFIFSSIFSLFVKVSVWSALIGTGNTVQGISYGDMVSYVIINTLLLSLVYSSIGQKLAAKVQDGSIANDFLRPVNLKYSLIFEQFGSNIFSTIFGTLPVCIISIIFLQFKLPSNPINFLLFLISMINGIALIFYINYTLGLLSFWFKSSFYIDWFQRAFFQLFGGTFVPLWFYPEALYAVSKILPFRLISFEPISIYLGKLNTSESINIILLQLIWIIVLVAIEKLLWIKAQKVVTVQGG